MSKFDLLQASFKQYTEALVSPRSHDEDHNLAIELAYDDIVRVMNANTQNDNPNYEQAIKFLDQAYDLSLDPNPLITVLVNGALTFASMAVES
jgi:hypothetical protein